GLVGEPEVGRPAIRLAEDGDRLDAQVVTCADDPQGDLSAVGNEDALEVLNALRHHCWKHDLSTVGDEDALEVLNALRHHCSHMACLALAFSFRLVPFS